MAKKERKTLGAVIDEIIGALEELEPNVRTTAVTAACVHLGIPIGNFSLESSAQPNVPDSQAPPPPPSKVEDIKALKEEKNPRSAAEMACVVAYYLQELAPQKERQDTIAVAELKKYFKQARFKLPKAMTQVLIDAKAAGYFDSPQRGSYKLNAVGYNLIAHTLPRGK